MDDLTNKICVAFEEENRYDDSYFYATFFNPEKNGIERFSRIHNKRRPKN
jgi:transposase